MNSKKEKGDNVSRFPKYGWKVSLDHEFSESWNQIIRPRLNQLKHFLPLFFRYLFFYVRTRLRGRRPFIDCISMENGKQIYGVPLGGIGSGTIGRGYKGEFCRYQMVPGRYEYNIVMANQFIVTIRNMEGTTLYQKVLSPHRNPKACLDSWDWGFNGADSLYCGLYPRSWTVYNIKEHAIRLICRQVSPVIPNNYKDSCLPVGVFVWTIENNSSEDRKVSITFCFKNGTGSKEDRNGECWSEIFTEKTDVNESKGCVLHQTLHGMKLSYGLAALGKPHVTTSVCLGFDPKGSGAEIWENLKEIGHLKTKISLPKTRKGEERSIAVCAQCNVMAGTSETVEISLVWYMPNIVFAGRKISHKRRYTRWFTVEDTAPREMALYALHQYKNWEEEIEEWQNPILRDPNLPDWFKSALFNELYFISDGGSVWLNIPENELQGFADSDPRIEYGRFGYLESHEYRMYNTYDVHFYASWALIMLWPHLQESLQYDMAMWTVSADLSQRTCLYSGNKAVRNMANTVPHDVGDPEDEPFSLVNGYLIHDCNQWKDLNLYFVLQVLRDYIFLKKKSYLIHMWPVCRAVMDSSFAHDHDSDGLIENSGTADQTFDSWRMHGPSAYCGSLWVAALAAMVEMAKILEDNKEEVKFEEALSKAQTALHEKLWNGRYYKFDSCNHAHSDSIMSAQLVGHWYLALSGVKPGTFKSECVNSVLNIIFEFNVMKFNGGQMGAVNGMNPNGTIDLYTIQSEEMWTGVAYSVASLMIYEGMSKEGFHTAEGIYRTVYEKIGMGFETPEALYQKNKYRAIGYMRPLAIWSMFQAYKMKKKDLDDDVKHHEQNGGTKH